MVNWTEEQFVKVSESGTKFDSVAIDRHKKLEFPRFHRVQIQEWLVHVEQYFEIEQTPEKYKIWLVSMHLDDLAKQWNRSLWHSVHDWETYKILLQEQFDASVAELRQLKETAGILAYHEQFELISARLNLPEDYLVQAYLNGLSLDTQRYVEEFQPQTVKACRCFGRLHEILYSNNPASYYAPSSKVSNATIEGEIVTMEDAGSVAAAEEVMRIEDKPVNILEDAESFSPAVEVTEFGDKHIHFSAEDDVYQSQKVGQQNTEQSDVIVDASNSEEEINQSCKARLNDFELLQTKDSSEHVFHSQGIVVEKDSMVIQAERQQTLLLINFLQPHEKCVTREFFFIWLLQLHSDVGLDTGQLRTSRQANILWDPGGIGCPNEARTIPVLQTETLASLTGENAALVMIYRFQVLFNQMELKDFTGTRVIQGSPKNTSAAIFSGTFLVQLDSGIHSQYKVLESPTQNKKLLVVTSFKEKDLLIFEENFMLLVLTGIDIDGNTVYDGLSTLRSNMKCFGEVDTDLALANTTDEPFALSRETAKELARRFDESHEKSRLRVIVLGSKTRRVWDPGGLQ